MITRIRVTLRQLASAAFTIAFFGVFAVAPSQADPTVGAWNCGNWNDSGGRYFLWDQVKGRTPTNPGTNLKVVFPEPSRNYGYAVHNGARRGTPSTYDYLLLPTNRVSGIECPKIWQPDALNLWQYARNAALRMPPKTNIALGINSAEGREQDQLHIHISRLRDDAKADIDAQRNRITSDPSQWRTTVIRVLNKDFRALHVPDLNANPFVLLKDNVATSDMYAQSLLVVPSPNGGYDLLDSQYSLSNHGVRQIEFLLNKVA